MEGEEGKEKEKEKEEKILVTDLLQECLKITCYHLLSPNNRPGVFDILSHLIVTASL